jgi:exodeoxyribonuclease V alpha subunit
MTIALDELVKQGMLSPLDRHFARSLVRLGHESDPTVELAAAIASRAVSRGHICADLGELHSEGLFADDDASIPALDLPASKAWHAALRRSPLVGVHPDPKQPRPLVLDEKGRLYLYRYADYQSRLALQIKTRAIVAESPNRALLQKGLARLFPGTDANDAQRKAAELAVSRRFSVISGGPGTGKTYTVAKILALLQEQALASGNAPLRIQLMAPTGKAAQRLGESIANSIDTLNIDAQTRDVIPRTASTLHRGLGRSAASATRFRHNADNPLPADVVIVDEASMVDLAMMTKLIEAIPHVGRLILLGDKDQLASVEAGAILGDIYSAGLENCTAELTHSHRYDDASGIGQLARAVIAGDADRAMHVLATANRVSVCDLKAVTDLGRALAPIVNSTFANLRRAAPAEKLSILSELRILTAHRNGPFGATRCNPVVEQVLGNAFHLQLDRDWYEGRPIIVTANDYQLDLWNGDVGVIGRAGENAPLEAFFQGRDRKTLRHLSPARLPDHETVFAMTVHKSQGSEFGRVLLLLPDRPSPVLTRELVYTAITRARDRVDIYGSESVLRHAIGRRVRRASGLVDLLRNA